jgi:hypothetical protein
MVYPASNASSREKFAWSNYRMNEGHMDQTEVVFHNGSYDYTVFHYINALGDEKSDGFSNTGGVRVSRAGKDIATFACGGEFQENLVDLSFFIPIVPANL